MSTPATLHHLADALTALRAARGATAYGDTADCIIDAEEACLRAVGQVAWAALSVAFNAAVAK